MNIIQSSGNMHTRRVFLSKLMTSIGAPVLLSRAALAQATPPVKLEESDPVAIALGYQADSTKVDAKKYPLHTREQTCSACALYQEKPGEALSPCTVFGGKVAPPGGWCSAFAKKPAVAP